MERWCSRWCVGCWVVLVGMVDAWSLVWIQRDGLGDCRSLIAAWKEIFCGFWMVDTRWILCGPFIGHFFCYVDLYTNHFRI